MKKAAFNQSPDGRIWADADGGWYYIVEITQDENEKRVLSSNSLAHIQAAAERWSVGSDNWQCTLSDLLVIDGQTHQAVAFYKKNEGLQEGWTEKNPQKARTRARAYQERQSLISYE